MGFWGQCKNLGQTAVEMFVTTFRVQGHCLVGLASGKLHFAEGVGKFFCGMCGRSECFVETSGLNSN